MIGPGCPLLRACCEELKRDSRLCLLVRIRAETLRLQERVERRCCCNSRWSLNFDGKLEQIPAIRQAPLLRCDFKWQARIAKLPSVGLDRTKNRQRLKINRLT